MDIKQQLIAGIKEQAVTVDADLDSDSPYTMAYLDTAIDVINELIPSNTVMVPMDAIVSAQAKRKAAMIGWEAGRGSDQDALFELDRILTAMLANKGD